MATEDQHKDENAASPLAQRGVARRRLAKAGAGVLLTLGSRGAMADVTCLTPSGYWSSGLNPNSSNFGHTTCTGGYSPGYWKQDQHAWPAGLDRETFMFVTAFPMAKTSGCPSAKATTAGATPPPATSYECIRLLDILSHQDFDTENFGMHMAATYLNIRAERITFLTVESLRQIWRDILATGVYHPTAGITWTRVDVVKYLKATMI